MTPPTYRDPAGERHEVEARQHSNGAWHVVDTCAAESRVIDTLADPRDGRPQAEAVARDYVSQVNRFPPVAGGGAGEAIPEQRGAYAHREPRPRSTAR